jgi:hypothetical protein
MFGLSRRGVCLPNIRAACCTAHASPDAATSVLELAFESNELDLCTHVVWLLNIRALRQSLRQSHRAL